MKKFFIRVKFILWSFPSLDFLVMKIKNRRILNIESDFSPKLASKSTRLVIEGFPRSANSYFTYKILFAQRKFDLAHHFHTPSQFYFAVKFKKRIIVVIRDPFKAAVSYSNREPKLSINDCLKIYRNFYSITLKHLVGYENFIVIDFNEIISNKFNSYFYEFTDIKPEEFTKSDADIFAEIERTSYLINGELHENKVARPSDARKNIAIEDCNINLNLYKECCDLYYRVKELKK